MGLPAVPKINAQSVMSIFKTPEVIAVGSAIILAPIVAPYISDFLDDYPLIKNHLTIAMTLVAILLLLIAVKMKGGVFRAVVIGVGGALFFVGIYPWVQENVVNRVLK